MTSNTESLRSLRSLKRYITDLPDIYRKYGEDYCFMKLQQELLPFKMLQQELLPFKMQLNSGLNMSEIKEQFRDMLFPLLLESDFIRYSYEKPLGYAGDFMTQIMIWEGRKNPERRYLGETPRGEILSAITFKMANCVANELRVNLLREYLSNGYSTIWSVGCGPAIEYWSQFNSNIKEISLLDQESKAIDFCKSKICPQFREKITYVNDNIMKCILRKDSKTYDFIYLFGLLDYFDIKNSKRIIENLWGKVNSGGALLFTNAHPLNNTRFWMEFAAEWVLFYKDTKGMYDITQDLEGVKEAAYKIDNVGVYQYLEVKKA